MFAAKFLLIFLFFSCMSLTTSITASTSHNPPLGESELTGINDTSTSDSGALQNRDINSSQDNGHPIINATLKGTIPLGKGKPLSMTINPSIDALYVVSPSELNGKLQNVIHGTACPPRDKPCD